MFRKETDTELNLTTVRSWSEPKSRVGCSTDWATQVSLFFFCCCCVYRRYLCIREKSPLWYELEVFFPLNVFLGFFSLWLCLLFSFIMQNFKIWCCQICQSFLLYLCILWQTFPTLRLKKTISPMYSSSTLRFSSPLCPYLIVWSI